MGVTLGTPMVNADVAMRRLAICMRCAERRGDRCTRDRFMIGFHAIGGMRCSLGYLEINPALASVHVTKMPSRCRVMGYRLRRRWLFLLNGIAGLYVAARKLCAADTAVVESRRATCDACEHRTTIMRLPICGKCKCAIDAKTAIGSEQCPAKKWEAVEVDGCRNQLDVPVIGRILKRAQPKSSRERGHCPWCNG